MAVGQSGQRTNAQLLYGPLVPQTDEYQLLCGRQPTIVMYNHMIKKCYTCDVRYDPNFMSPPHIIWSYTPKQEGPGLLMAEKLDAKTIQMHTTALITLHVSGRNYQVVLRIICTWEISISRV